MFRTSSYQSEPTERTETGTILWHLVRVGNQIEKKLQTDTSTGTRVRAVLHFIKTFCSSSVPIGWCEYSTIPGVSGVFLYSSPALKFGWPHCKKKQ